MLQPAHVPCLNKSLFTLDAPHRAGLGLALLTMRPGERALVRVGAASAYGEQGSFSFPSVAPGAELVYDVELLSIEHANIRPVRVRADMVWEERMAEAQKYRDTGNAAFKDGRAEEALTQYLAARTRACCSVLRPADECVYRPLWRAGDVVH